MGALLWRAGKSLTRVVDAIVRCLVLGPLVGALIGALQTAAAFHVWNFAGKPDFYFGGRGTMGMEFPLFAFGGAVVGVPFGISVIVFEQTTKRRVPVMLFIALLGLTSYLIAFAVVLVEFSLRQLFPFVAEGATIAAGWALMFCLSRPTPNSNEPTTLQAAGEPIIRTDMKWVAAMIGALVGFMVGSYVGAMGADGRDAWQTVLFCGPVYPFAAVFDNNLGYFWASGIGTAVLYGIYGWCLVHFRWWRTVPAIAMLHVPFALLALWV